VGLRRGGDSLIGRLWAAGPGADWIFEAYYQKGSTSAVTSGSVLSE
jgi:hypothetical protein